MMAGFYKIIDDHVWDDNFGNLVIAKYGLDTFHKIIPILSFITRCLETDEKTGEVIAKVGYKSIMKAIRVKNRNGVAKALKAMTEIGMIEYKRGFKFGKSGCAPNRYKVKKSSEWNEPFKEVVVQVKELVINT